MQPQIPHRISHVPCSDRMELIEVNSYTENEKFHIAKEHLLHKQMEKNGITGRWLSVSDSALKAIISSYTREAGVRELERKYSGDLPQGSEGNSGMP